MSLEAKPFVRVSSSLNPHLPTRQSGRNRSNGEVDFVSQIAANGGARCVKRGSGNLEVQMVSGMSAATSVCASSPMKILVPHPRGVSVWAYLSSFGGGMVAGDETRVVVKLGAGTRCFLSTQASTKIYRNPQNRPCGHQLSADLDEGSVLVLAPDAVQPFAGSVYQQRQEFHLAAGSGLVLVDWLSSGRAECGERWEFNRYQSRNNIFVAGTRVLVDAVLLDGEQGMLAGSHRMGRMNCVATLAVIGEPLQVAITEILKNVADLPISRRANLVWSASAIKTGVLVRIAGEDVETVRREIHRQLDFLPGLLHDDPWTRKW
jgi:urease accessory protein